MMQYRNANSIIIPNNGLKRLHNAQRGHAFPSGQLIGALNAEVADWSAIWWPYLPFLKYFGMHVVGHCATSKEEGKTARTFWKNPWTWYCGLVLVETFAVAILSRGRVVRMSAYTFKFNHECIGFIVGFIWPFAELGSLIILFLASWSRSGFSRVFFLFSRLKLSHSRRIKLEARVRSLTRCVFAVYLTYSIIQVSSYFQVALELNFPDKVFRWNSRGFLQIIRGFNVACSVHIVGFIVLVSLTLCLVFDEVNRTLCQDRQTMDFDDGLASLHFNLEGYVEAFRSATKLTNAVDKIFSWVIGLYFLSCMFQTIFNTYLLIYRKEASNIFTFLPVDCYWLVESTFAVLSISIATVAVNHKAHEAYDILCCIKLEKMPLHQQIIVGNLQNRLTNTAIGLTTFGIQVMRKQVLYSVASLYMTYVFLALQFNS